MRSLDGCGARVRRAERFLALIEDDHGHAIGEEASCEAGANAAVEPEHAAALCDDVARAHKDAGVGGHARPKHLAGWEALLREGGLAGTVNA